MPASPAVSLCLFTAADLAPALLDEVVELEAAAFVRPWGRAALLSTLAQSGAAMAVLRDVPTDGDGPPQLLAFCLHQQILDELHVLQMATHPQHRRRGHGSALLGGLLQAARARGCAEMLLEVRSGNLPAVALYESLGFTRLAVRARYYQDNGEDALVMRCALAGDDVAAAPAR